MVDILAAPRRIALQVEYVRDHARIFLIISVNGVVLRIQWGSPTRHLDGTPSLHNSYIRCATGPLSTVLTLC